MKPADLTCAEIAPPEPKNLPGWRLALRQGENLIVVVALGAMMLLPAIEIFLSKFFHSGIPASLPIVQHLVLVVGMLGGAIAARENRLLALSAATQWFKGGVLTAARVFSHGFAAAVSAFLCGASWDFVQDQRALGSELAYGVPRWIVQLLLVIGFAFITLRLIWHASEAWRWRLAALGLAVIFAGVALWLPVDPGKLRWPAIAVLLTAIVCGAPVFTALGGAALILLWSGGETISTVPLKLYHLTVDAALPSIPLFTLVGYLLAESGSSKRLVRVFLAFAGHLRGGPAIVTALTCAFFTAFTGGSGVTILALGAVLLPILREARYPERPALGLLTGAGSLGLLFPPCLPPILYSIVASSGRLTSVSMHDMFKGGFLPGMLLVGMTIWWGARMGGKREPGEVRRFDRKEAWQAVWGAKWELLIPVVALSALFGGFASPVEAAALTALYAFIVEVIIYRDLNLFRDIPRVMTECALLIGGVLLILGVAYGFTYYMVDAQIPDQAVEWATATIKSKWLFLLCLNIVLIFVGGLVEIYAAIVVVVPLLVPIGIAFGIDPVHLGIIFLANMELAFLAPPVGLNLLLASYRFDKPLLEVTRAALPMLAVLLIGVLLITYVPWLTTWLPSVWK